MAIQRSNADAFNDAQKYSEFLIQTLPDIMLPDNMYRNVSDFADGTTLNIATTGAATIQEVAEGIPLNFTAIDSGTVTMSINEYVGDAWFVSDEVRQDFRRIAALEAARAQESAIALAEWHETNFLKALNAGQTAGDPNVINGVNHRIPGTGTSGVITLEDISRMKYAFDKARVPAQGRVLFVDPSVEFTFNQLAQVVTSDNPMFEGIVTEGFAQSHKFIRNIYGFDIWTTNYLPTGSFDDGTTTITDGVANIAMSLMSDQHTPAMYAQRVAPSIEGWRDHEERREKFQTTTRDGFGIQRVDTLGVIYTLATV